MHPYLIQPGHISLPTFAALAVLGLMLGLGLSLRTARLAGVDPERLWNAGLFAVLAAFAVSRVLLAVEHFARFRQFPLLLLASPSLTPAGLLAAVTVTLLWQWWRGVEVLRALDAWAPCGLLVWAFLALGHWAEGSDPGVALRFGPRAGAHDATHPVALYACVLALLLAGWMYRRLSAGRRGRPGGQTAGLALVAAGLAQFLLSFLRAPGADAGLALDALQWVALGMLVCGLLLATVPAGEVMEL